MDDDHLKTHRRLRGGPVTQPPPHQPPAPAQGYAGPPPPQGPPPQGPPPQGPPPGYQYPSAFGQQSRPPASRGTGAIWSLAALSVLCVVLGLSLNENGSNEWSSTHAWGVLAIVGAVLSAGSVIGPALGLSTARSWQVSSCGGGALALYWVLLVLPSVGSNMSFVTTIGVAAGLIAVWIAPDRPSTSSPTATAPPGQRW